MEKAKEDGPRAGVPATEMGDPDGFLQSWLQPGPISVVTAIWEVNQDIAD